MCCVPADRENTKIYTGNTYYTNINAANRAYTKEIINKQ